MNYISNFLNLIHGFIVFFPLLIYVIPLEYLVGWYRYITWICLMVPLHWPLFENKCIISIASETSGDFKKKIGRAHV